MTGRAMDDARSGSLLSGATAWPELVEGKPCSPLPGASVDPMSAPIRGSLIVRQSGTNTTTW